MKHILLNKDLNLSDKEEQLSAFFATYQPKMSPFLLGEFALSHHDYAILSDYFLSNELHRTFYRYPLIFAFLITEFAYWTDDWDSNDSFWESFESKFKIPFSPHIYWAIRKGYNRLKVIRQPETGFKYVNWCTMQSVLGRNAIRRLAELIQYLRKIGSEKIRKEFETSYIVDLKLAVLGHFYQLAPSTVLSFLENLIKGEYRKCIYFRQDEKFITDFEELLEQRLFYPQIFSSQQIAEPVFFFKDDRIKFHFSEDSLVAIDDLEIKKYRGQRIIAKYGNNVRKTKWQQNKLLWQESFNVFIQSRHQFVGFFLENSEEQIAQLSLPRLTDKEFWIFDSDGDLLNDNKDEIVINFEEALLIKFVTSAINKITNLTIEEEPVEYPDEERQYFVFKFKPDFKKIKETLGTYDLIYEFPNSIRFDCLPVFRNKKDNLPVLCELPDIYFDQDIPTQEILIEINNEEVPAERITQSLVQEEPFHILSLEGIYSWKLFGRYRIDILTAKNSAFFEFYYLRDLDRVTLMHFKDKYELQIYFLKKNYDVPNGYRLKSKSHAFTISKNDDSHVIKFTVKRLKRDETLSFGINTVHPHSRIIHEQKDIHESEVNLIDLYNLPLSIEIIGQPDESFNLALISDENNPLGNFGAQFTFSSSGRFILGRTFWRKHYSQIRKQLEGRNGTINFCYDRIPFSKPFSFNVCKLVNQKPKIKQFDITLNQNQIEIQTDIKEVPLNTVRLFLFNSDYSHDENHSFEDELRIPSQELKISKRYPVPAFLNDGILYACLATSDGILSSVEQVKLKQRPQLNNLAALINFAFTNMVQKELDLNAEIKSEQIQEHLRVILSNPATFHKFNSFINKPLIRDIFQESVLKIILENRLLMWNLLLGTDDALQQKFLSFIVLSGGLDFFCSCLGERYYLKKKWATFNWDNSHSVQRLVRVQLFGYWGLHGEEIQYIRDQEGRPPFTSSAPILVDIYEKYNQIKNDKNSFRNAKCGELLNASENLRRWYFNLQMKASEISDIFGIFYNYWFLGENSQKKSSSAEKMISVFQKNQALFYNLMILKEIVFRWEQEKVDNPHESDS